MTTTTPPSSAALNPADTFRRRRSARAWGASLILTTALVWSAAADTAVSHAASSHTALVHLAVCATLILCSLLLAFRPAGVKGFMWSMSGPVEIFCLLRYGTADAVAASVVCIFVVEMGRRRYNQAIFNAAEAALYVGAAGLTFTLLGGHPAHASLPSVYAPALGAVIVLCLVNYALVATSYALIDCANPLSNWLEEMRLLPKESAAAMLESSVGALAALLAVREPWLLPLLIPASVSVVVAQFRGVRVQSVTERALEAFARVIDERDTHTAQHSSRVCEYAMKIGEELGFTAGQMHRLYWTSMLHDLGKVSVDNAVLNKPGKLTDDEFDLIKQHPVVSARILQDFKFDSYDVEVVRCHHERFDGRGYLKLPASEVPFEAHIIAVADTFDAMTSDRPYRKGLPIEVALEEIQRNIGTQFEPRAAEAFLAAMRFSAPRNDEQPSEQYVALAGQLGSAGTDRATAEPIDNVFPLPRRNGEPRFRAA